MANENGTTTKKQKDSVTKDFIEKAERLAKISKRREEIKEKLEVGQMKADEAADLGTEYKILNNAYKDLLKELE